MPATPAKPPNTAITIRAPSNPSPPSTICRIARIFTCCCMGFPSEQYTREGAPGFGLLRGNLEGRRLRAFAIVHTDGGDCVAVLLSSFNGMVAERRRGDHAGDLRERTVLDRPVDVVAAEAGLGVPFP